MNEKSLEKNKKQGFFSILTEPLLYNKIHNPIELIKIIKKSHKNSVINKIIYKILTNVVSIKNKRIKEIMIPKSHMKTLKINYSFTKCLEIVMNSPYSHFPVMSEDSNYVKGIIVAKNFIPYIKNKKFYIKEILIPPNIIPESKRIDNTLQYFQKHQNHMAIVIDEFGVVSGLVTMQNIFNLILKNLAKPNNNNINQNIKKINSHIFSINALTQIQEFNKVFQTKFNTIGVDTIGGFIMQQFKHLPNAGDQINIQGYNFKITTTNNRKILQLQIEIPNNKI